MTKHVEFIASLFCLCLIFMFVYICLFHSELVLYSTRIYNMFCIYYLCYLQSQTHVKALASSNKQRLIDRQTYQEQKALNNYPTYTKDPRYSSLTDKGKDCFQRYNEWAVCMQKADGEVEPNQLRATANPHPCLETFNQMNLLCPSYWQSRWQGLREDNLWFGQGGQGWNGPDEVEDDE